MDRTVTPSGVSKWEGANAVNFLTETNFPVLLLEKMEQFSLALPTKKSTPSMVMTGPRSGNLPPETS
jgi:hypothetical protein